MKKITFFIMVLLSLSLSSCYIQHFNSGGLTNDIYMNEPAGRNDKWVSLGNFEFRDKTQYIFFNLFAVSKVEVADVIKQELTKRGGDGIVNLSIESRLEPPDALFQLIYPFYGQRTVIIKGEVFKKK
jgi:hypothetical protein